MQLDTFDSALSKLCLIHRQSLRAGVGSFAWTGRLSEVGRLPCQNKENVRSSWKSKQILHFLCTQDRWVQALEPQRWAYLGEHFWLCRATSHLGQLRHVPFLRVLRQHSNDYTWGCVND